MLEIDQVRFVRSWMKRSERTGVPIDKADQFLNLWIAFDSWLKIEYNKERYERDMIKEWKSNEEFIRIFEELKKDQNYNKILEELASQTVRNMKYPNDDDIIIKYKGDFSTLCGMIYQIRCNLFHGQKNPEKDKKDKALVYLAFDILYPLFRSYLERMGYY